MGGALLAVGVVPGVLTLVLLPVAGAWGLATVLPSWAALLIVAVLVAAVGGSLRLAGAGRPSEIDPVPRRTLETLRGNREWLRERVR